ncbi:MAG: SelB C-terminal domain-containing protein, partial [bacterium]
GVSLEHVTSLSHWLVREGVLVAVESDRYYTVGAVGVLRERLALGMDGGREYSPSELREVLDLTRKFLIPFLEYCDREGYTFRSASGARKRGT